VEDEVLVIRRIHVRHRLRLSPAQREAAEQAHARHAEMCPLFRTLRRCVAISTALELEPA
jgi:uncharacterized OsmC-like protein